MKILIFISTITIGILLIRTAYNASHKKSKRQNKACNPAKRIRLANFNVVSGVKITIPSTQSVLAKYLLMGF